MTVSNTISGAFVWLFLIIIAVGMGLGLLLNNTDVVNYMRNGAVAEQQRIANQYEAAQNQIDLQYYRVERQRQAVENLRQISAQSQAQIDQAEEDLRVQREDNDLRLQMADAVVRVLVGLGIGLSAAASLGITFMLYRLAQFLTASPSPARARKARTPTPAAVNGEPWHDPIHRAWRVAQARSRELKDLEQRAAQRSGPGRARVVARR